MNKLTKTIIAGLITVSASAQAIAHCGYHGPCTYWSYVPAPVTVYVPQTYAYSPPVYYVQPQPYVFQSYQQPYYRGPSFGNAVGGALGGYLGNQIGNGSAAATAAGAVMGFMMGGN